ncbi:MAG: hypothetical protein ABR583_13565 [Gaiellaceae bacterium]
MPRLATTAICAALVGVVAALALLAAAPVAHAAAKPCWELVQNDWTENRLGERTYAPSCYDEAIRKLPKDVEIYSDAADAILAARDEAIRNKQNRQPSGRGNGEGGSENGGGSSRGGDDGGPLGGLLNAGPSAVDDVPLPLLLLGGVALLLMAAGGAGLVSRRLQGRGIRPADAGPGPGDGSL